MDILDECISTDGKHNKFVLNRKAAWFSLWAGEFSFLVHISYAMCGHHTTSSVIFAAEKHMLPLELGLHFGCIMNFSLESWRNLISFEK